MAKPFWDAPSMFNRSKFDADHPWWDGYEFAFSVVPEGWDEEVDLWESWYYPTRRLISPTGTVATRALNELTLSDHGREVVAKSLGEEGQDVRRVQVWYHVWCYEEGRLLDNSEDDEPFGPRIMNL